MKGRRAGQHSASGVRRTQQLGGCRGSARLGLASRDLQGVGEQAKIETEGRKTPGKRVTARRLGLAATVTNSKRLEEDKSHEHCHTQCEQDAKWGTRECLKGVKEQISWWHGMKR